MTLSAEAATLPRVSGRVLDLEGHPLPGVQVARYPEFDNIATSAADGTFAYQAPADADTVLVFLFNGYDHGRVAGGVQTNTTAFDLQGDLELGDIRFPEPTSTTLKTVDRDGDPVTGVTAGFECFQARTPYGGSANANANSWTGPHVELGPKLTEDWTLYNLHIVYQGNGQTQIGTGVDGTAKLLVPQIDDDTLPTNAPLAYTAADGTRYSYDLSEATHEGDRWVLHMTDLDVPHRGVPGQPTGLTATRRAGGANLSWTAPANNGSDITGYTVTADPGGETVTVAGNATSASMTGLTNGQEYRFTATATNALGTSPASDESNPVTPGAAPSSPQAVNAVGGDRSAHVTWAAPETDYGSAVIGYEVTTTPATTAVAAGPNATFADITDLRNGTKYVIHVRAINAVGTSDPGSSGSIRPAAKPAPVAAPKVKVTGTTAAVSWTAPEDGGSRILLYVISVDKESYSVSGSKTSVKLKHLRTGRHTVMVQAENAYGRSKAGKAVRFRIR